MARNHGTIVREIRGLRGSSALPQQVRQVRRLRDGERLDVLLGRRLRLGLRLGAERDALQGDDLAVDGGAGVEDDAAAVQGAEDHAALADGDLAGGDEVALHLGPGAQLDVAVAAQGAEDAHALAEAGVAAHGGVAQDAHALGGVEVAGDVEGRHGQDGAVGHEEEALADGDAGGGLVLLQLLEDARHLGAVGESHQFQEVEEDVDDEGHGVALVDPALGAEAAADAHVVADVEVEGHLEVALDEAALAEEAGAADVGAALDVGGGVGAQVAAARDVAAHRDAVAQQDAAGAAQAVGAAHVVAQDEVGRRRQAALLEDGALRQDQRPLVERHG